MPDQSFLAWPFFEDHHRRFAGGLTRGQRRRQVGKLLRQRAT